MTALHPQPQARTVDDLLEEARVALTRLAPEQAAERMDAGAVLIDIRSESQRAADGVIPGARFIARNVLEWRCDPASPWSDPEIVQPPRRQLILFCDAGYQSSLAAAILQQLGHQDATDMIGGFKAWRQLGLPIADE